MRRWAAIAAGLVLMSCQTGQDTGSMGLALSVEEGAASGVYRSEKGVVRLEAVEVEPMVFEVTLEVNGMTLDGVIDRTQGVVASLDGFAAENGEDTQMTDEDRALLSEAYRALNEEFGKEAPEVVVMLRRAVGLWAEHPSTLELTRTVMGEEGRGYTMLCSYAYCGTWSGACSYWNWYSYATHDCCYGGVWGVGGTCTDRYDSDTSQVAQIGDHYSCSGDTWVWTGSSWACGEPDHWTYPYEVGNCWGRCGEGCGGDTQYTKDCTDHDGCVRNGHYTTSAWCNDEFAGASDDELGAPNCY